MSLRDRKIGSRRVEINNNWAKKFGKRLYNNPNIIAKLKFFSWFLTFLGVRKDLCRIWRKIQFGETNLAIWRNIWNLYRNVLLNLTILYKYLLNFTFRQIYLAKLSFTQICICQIVLRQKYFDKLYFSSNCLKSKCPQTFFIYLKIDFFK